jgi:hypothetical protein
MASITTRAGKGSPLTNAELDANFTNLNTELGQKLVASDLSPYLLSATAASTYQSILVSGTSIKTVNGQSVLGSGNIQIDGGVTSFNTRTGAVTLSSGDVTTALGFTPYNSTNPDGYITSSALSSYLPLTGGSMMGNVSYVGNLTTTYGPNNQSGTLRIGGFSRQDTSFSSIYAYGSGLNIDSANGGSLFLNTGSGGSIYGPGGSIVLHTNNISSWALPISGGTLTGNLGFGGTGRRITADLSNATVANRLLVQTSTANSQTLFGLIPSGTAQNSQFQAYNSSDPANSSLGTFTAASGTIRIVSGFTGTGSTLPIVFVFNSTEAARFATNGNFLVGTQTDDGVNKLQVNGSVAISGNTALHAGNYSSYALPLTGGTLTTSTDQFLTFNKSGGTGWSYFGFAHSGTRRFYFGLNSSFEPELGVDNGATFRVLPNMTVAGSQVLHAGNYSSYALPLTGGSLTTGATNNIFIGRNSTATAYNAISLNGNSADSSNMGLTGGGGSDSTLYVNSPGNIVLRTNGFGQTYTLSSSGFSGNAATATTASSVSGLTLNSVSAPINPDNVTQNQIGYNTSVSLFGQSDGGLYSSAYSSSWIHQIYGDFRTGQIAIRGKNSGAWQAWRTVLDSGNYSSYALPLSGGQMSGHIAWAGYSDTVNGSSWYGLGRTSSDLQGSGSTQMQLAGYYGLRLRTASTILDMNMGNVSLNQTLNVTGPALRQGNNLARPLAQWSASGTSTGMVYIELPGSSPANYGMIHAVIDVYEYDGNAASTIIVGGHNWSGSWYNVSCNVIGQTNKQVRLAVRNGKFVICLGDASSTWSYGTVMLRKIHNAGFYDNVIDMGAQFVIAQTTSEGLSGSSGDLRQLRTPLSMRAYSYQGHSNVDGTGNASYHPSGVYSTGTNWLYGTVYMNGNTIEGCGRMNGPWSSSARCYSNEWIEFPNYSGLYSPLNSAHFYPNSGSYGSWRIAGTRNGWYGLHFDSGSTLMMNSATVGFHREGYGWQMRWDSGTGYISKGNPGGGTDALILDSANYGSYALPLSGGTMSGTIYSSAASLVIGQNGGVTRGYLYNDSAGIGFLTNGGSWAAYVPYGTNNFQVNGSLTASGNVTAYSDERLKKDWADLPEDFVERLAEVKNGTFTRTDSGKRQAGSSAQDWQNLLPEVVEVGADDANTLALAYGNAALVSVIELAKELVALRREVAALKGAH